MREKELNFVSPNWWLLRCGEKAKVVSSTIRNGETIYSGITQFGREFEWDCNGLEMKHRGEYDLMERLRGEGNIADVTTK